MSSAMLRLLVVAFINGLLVLRHAWNALWRARVHWVRLDVGGDLPEFLPRVGLLKRWLVKGPPVQHLVQLRRQMERIGADPHCKGVVLRIMHLDAGWATLQSLRAEVARLKQCNKRVVAFLEEPTQKGYYLACAAHQVLMPPAGWLHVTGFRNELRFIKDTLARVGIRVEVEAVSPYKSAAETLVRSDISPENRAQLDRLVDGRLRDFVNAVAEGRHLPPERVREAMDGAPLTAAAAMQAGLLDGLCYEDELETRLGDGGKKTSLVDWEEADGVLRKPYQRWRRGKLVALVSVEGTLVRGRSHHSPVPLPVVGSAQAGAETVCNALRQVERNDRVAAVILHVDSRGGDAYASDLIWRDVMRLRKRKPVVAVLGNVAGSGGYYVAAPANVIVAQRGTLTGSIGVLMIRPVATGLLELASVNQVVIQRGRNAGLLLVTSEVTEGERQAMRCLVASAYQEFLNRVETGRNLPHDRMEEVAGGRVWLGEEAVHNGLVDVLGGMREGLARAQELAGLPKDPSSPLMLVKGPGEHQTPRPFSVDWMGFKQTLRHLVHPNLWALLPFEEP